MLSYHKGDLFKYVSQVTEPLIIPHVCNNAGAWGAGFVIPLGIQFPKAKAKYVKLHREATILEKKKYMPWGTHFIKYNDTVIANMVAQTLDSKHRNLRYDVLVDCMRDVASYCGETMIGKIVCPAFGSGLAGGDWDFIEELIKDIWGATLDVVVCQL